MTHEAVARFLSSISINSKFSPTTRGVFDVHTLYRISLACHSLADQILYRAIFLTAFYGFLHMSNIAPHSSSKFDPNYHFTRQDIIFGPPGVHLVIKWTKTLQHHRSHHILQLPTIQNHFLCPVKTLLAFRILPPSVPLFANNVSPYRQVIDTHVRGALKKVLSQITIPLRPHGFHTFRRSGATLAFDDNITLQNIMPNRLWRSSAIRTYLQNVSLAPSIIPFTFALVIPTNF